MFIVFFNNLQKSIGGSEVITYADDTVIFCANTKVQNIENTLNYDMTLIQDYCYCNELVLNLKKEKRKLCSLETHKG
jgi:hypothetical protein